MTTGATTACGGACVGGFAGRGASTMSGGGAVTRAGLGAGRGGGVLTRTTGLEILRTGLAGDFALAMGGGVGMVSPPPPPPPPGPGLNEIHHLAGSAGGMTNGGLLGVSRP